MVIADAGNPAFRMLDRRDRRTRGVRPPDDPDACAPASSFSVLATALDRELPTFTIPVTMTTAKEGHATT